MGGDHAEWRARVPQGGSDGGVGLRNLKFEIRNAKFENRPAGEGGAVVAVGDHDANYYG